MTTFLFIFFIVAGVAGFLSLIGGFINSSVDGIFGGIFIIVSSIALLYVLQDSTNWQENKQTVYVKPKIELLKEYPDKYIYLFDDEIFEKTEKKWDNTNRIYKRIEHLDGETNISYVIKNENKKGYK